MNRTAPATRKLAAMNCNYLALRTQERQNTRCMRYDPILKQLIDNQRSEIVELQSKLRKGGKQARA